MTARCRFFLGVFFLCLFGSTRPQYSCPPFPEYSYYPSRPQEPAALSALIDATHSRSATDVCGTIMRCVFVSLDVLRGFDPDVSQSYHNRVAHLPGVARYA
jgi:hypothetical protein